MNNDNNQNHQEFQGNSAPEQNQTAGQSAEQTHLNEASAQNQQYNDRTDAASGQQGAYSENQQYSYSNQGQNSYSQNNYSQNSYSDGSETRAFNIPTHNGQNQGR